jgi:hypothetical protein
VPRAVIGYSKIQDNANLDPARGLSMPAILSLSTRLRPGDAHFVSLCGTGATVVLWGGVLAGNAEIKKSFIDMLSDSPS